MGRWDRFCQSCGMPMEMDPSGGGTEADGSRISRYCSHCYENGLFRDGFTSPDQMIALAKDHLKQQGMGPLKRWFYTMHISRLERWRR